MLSLIPISDANPTRRFPVLTITLIVINVVVFFFVQPGFGQGEAATRYFFENAPVPCQISEGCTSADAVDEAGEVGIPAEVLPRLIPERDIGSFLLATLASTFFHAGFLHIAGNMLFLWVFGNNIEDHLGPVKFILFYLAGGLAAGLAHVFTHINSVLPAVGASGAVAAVMGAYILLFPHARVRVLVPIFILWTVLQMSAIVVLGLWFVYQFFIGLQEVSGATAVAWMAHVGGFVFGVVGMFLLGGRPQRRQPAWDAGWRY